MMYEHSERKKTLEDTLFTSTPANMIRLKALLQCFAKLPIEYRVIGLLCDGYKRADVEDALNVSRQRVENILRKYKARLTAQQIEDVFSILKED